MALEEQHKDDIQKRRPGRPAKGDEAIPRDVLLEAALKAFAEKGYEGVSVRELTRQWDVSHNLIHHHFGSKEGLWKAAVDHAVRQLPEGINELLSPDAPEGEEIQRIHDASYRIALMAATHTDYFKVLMDESAQGGPRFDYIYENYMRQTTETVQTFFERAHARGEARAMPPGVGHIILLGAISAPFTMRALAARLVQEGDRRPPTPEEGARAIADILVYGVVQPK